MLKKKVLRLCCKKDTYLFSNIGFLILRRLQDLSFYNYLNEGKKLHVLHDSEIIQLSDVDGRGAKGGGVGREGTEPNEWGVD